MWGEEGDRVKVAILTYKIKIIIIACNIPHMREEENERDKNSILPHLYRDTMSILQCNKKPSQYHDSSLNFLKSPSASVLQNICYTSLSYMKWIFGVVALTFLISLAEICRTVFKGSGFNSSNSTQTCKTDNLWDISLLISESLVSLLVCVSATTTMLGKMEWIILPPCCPFPHDHITQTTSTYHLEMMWVSFVLSLN